MAGSTLRRTFRRALRIALLIGVGGFWLWNEFGREGRQLPPPVDHTVPDVSGLNPRNAFLAVARSQVGVAERTGRNDGEVGKYLEAVGRDPDDGDPYCAAFLYWCSRHAGSDHFPMSAWSPNFVEDPNWLQGKGPEPKPGDIFGIFHESKGRVGHVGIIEEVHEDYFVTIEANTSSQARSGSSEDREGSEGVLRKRRQIEDVYSIKSWFD